MAITNGASLTLLRTKTFSKLNELAITCQAGCRVYDQFPSNRPSLGKRFSRAVARFLVTFCIGVAATLAWLSYGDAARETIASSSPQLGWLAPQAAAPQPAAPAAPPADQQQLNAISFGLAAVRQSVD
jgi:hypothetical protein